MLPRRGQASVKNTRRCTALKPQKYSQSNLFIIVDRDLTTDDSHWLRSTILGSLVSPIDFINNHKRCLWARVICTEWTNICYSLLNRTCIAFQLNNLYYLNITHMTNLQDTIKLGIIEIHSADIQRIEPMPIESEKYQGCLGIDNQVVKKFLV